MGVGKRAWSNDEACVVKPHGWIAAAISPYIVPRPGPAFGLGCVPETDPNKRCMRGSMRKHMEEDDAARDGREIQTCAIESFPTCTSSNNNNNNYQYTSRRCVCVCVFRTPTTPDAGPDHRQGRDPLRGGGVDPVHHRSGAQAGPARGITPLRRTGQAVPTSLYRLGRCSTNGLHMTDE